MWETVLPYRFTPTCEGTASRRRPPARSTQVHPHVRGDGARYRTFGRILAGSPPRAWGRPVGSPPRAWGRRRIKPCAVGTCRFTPTCVGTANALTDFVFNAPVHPHVRGDGALTARRYTSLTGSPPRAWGRLRYRRARPGASRFTPTCVGTAARAGSSSMPITVHPHVRGDGFAGRHVFRVPSGSPPRAWGRRWPGRAPAPRARFTPTCVGTATYLPLDPFYGPVHPHVRGDGSSTADTRPAPCGSPPRAWGRRGVVHRDGHDIRFTPTCVGTAGCC